MLILLALCLTLIIYTVYAYSVYDKVLIKHWRKYIMLIGTDLALCYIVARSLIQLFVPTGDYVVLIIVTLIYLWINDIVHGRRICLMRYEVLRQR